MCDSTFTDPGVELPTIEQCQEFLHKINEGRALIDQPPLEFIDFDSACPGDPFNCLSARNLYFLAGYKVGGCSLDERNTSFSKINQRVLELSYDSENSLSIPGEILAVTNYFDACGEFYDDSVQLKILRERMVEAGVVKPKED
jgi:hypothetical protein